MHFQLAEVDRPLISVARLVDAGNRVVFGPTGGFIAHVATGRKVQLVRDGNVYLLDMRVPRRRRRVEVEARRRSRVLPGRSVEGCSGSPVRRPRECAGPLRKSFSENVSEN